MHGNIRRLAALLLISLGSVALGLTYWQVVRANDLVYSADNARIVEQASKNVRGRIFDSSGKLLAYDQPTAQGMERRYTDPTLSPVIGYFGPRYGVAGLEDSYSRYLNGDVQANPFTTLANQALHRPQTGDNLYLTIDSHLQSVAVAAMGSYKGSIVALDPRTGAVLAMVSTPYFDPNNLDAEWAQLRSDPDDPLLDRATMGLYTPGSVFKIITASAAIDLGLVDINKHYTCSKDLVIDGFVIKNKNHPGVTDVTYADDFAYSCNVTFAKTGLGLGYDPLPVGDNIPNPAPWDKSIDESRKRFLEYTQRYGLEAPIPFDLPTSISTVGNQNLNRVELANSAFGQGRVQVSPLQMALAAATVANGGKMPRPYLVSEIRDPSGNVVQHHSPQIIRQVISPESARLMNQLMETSVKEGYAHPATIPGVLVGGKTGSAEVAPGEKTHSWFIGYAPADNPVIAIAVIMEHAGPGTDFATPAGQKVMAAALGR